MTAIMSNGKPNISRAKGISIYAGLDQEQRANAPKLLTFQSMRRYVSLDQRESCPFQVPSKRKDEARRIIKPKVGRIFIQHFKDVH